MGSLIFAGRRLPLPAALIRHAATRTDRASIARWARFWAAMTVLALLPLLYVLMSQARGIRYGLLQGVPIFRPADWVVALGTRPNGELTAIGLITLVVLFGGTLLAFDFSNDLYDHYNQRAFDLRAAAIYRSAMDARPTEPFVLYLRPFVSTGAHKVRVNPGGKAVREYDLERELKRACAAIGPLIAIGESLEHLGAGRVSSSDKEWKTAIPALMQHAQLIVMLPSVRPGTLWELEQLVMRNWIAKTVFIDAPNTTVTGYRQETEWGDIASFLAGHGYKLPDDDPKGRLFAFGESGTPRIAERVDFSDAQMLRGVLVRALPPGQRSESLTTLRSGRFGAMTAGALGGLLVGSAAFGLLSSAVLYDTLRHETGSRRRTASMAAQLDPNYRHLTNYRGVDLGYAVTYHFVVDGRTYTGEDTTTKPPIIAQAWPDSLPRTTVYYEPADPSNNHVEGHKVYSTLHLIMESVVLGSITLLCVIVFFRAGGSAARSVFTRRS